MYHLINNRLNKTKCYIINGDPCKTDYEIIDDKLLLLPCEDTYEELTNKTLSMLKTVSIIYPSCKGIIKCDDDILPNIKSINDFILYLDTNPDKAYIGNVTTTHATSSMEHYYKVTDTKYNFPMNVPNCTYANGPLYYINMNTVRILNEIWVDKFFYEDIVIGYNLNKRGIYPEYYFIYSNYFHEKHLTNYQNTNNKKCIYVTLQGSLQDISRQIACGYGIAKNKNMYLIFIHDHVLEEPLLRILEHFQYIETKHMQYDVICVNQDEMNDISNDKNIWVNMYLQDDQHLEYQNKVLGLLTNSSVNNEDIVSLFS